MLRSVGNAIASSVGKKIVLGLTGLLLVGFLAEHLHGNLKLYEGDEGAHFDEYVEFLQGFGPLLVVAEIGLALLFAAHIFLAIHLTLENRRARKDRYVVRNDRGAQTLGSASMFVTGALILAFLFKHLYDFRFDGAFFEDPAGMVGAKLSQPGTAILYGIAAIVVGVHLSHGIRSAFQSLGVSSPKLAPVLEKAGLAVAALVALGFASFPVYFLFIWDAGS